MLVLADTQILTGIAILVSGYGSLHRCLSMYHWQMIVILATFSTSTHLAALTFLRGYFHTHPAQRTIRITGMAALFVLLFVAMVPASHFGTVRRGAFARCFFRAGWDKGSDGYITFVFGGILLTYASALRVVKLFRSSSKAGAGLRDRAGRMFRVPVDDIMRRFPPEESRTNQLMNVPPLTGYVLVQFYLDLYTSMAAEVSRGLIYSAFPSSSSSSSSTYSCSSCSSASSFRGISTYSSSGLRYMPCAPWLYGLLSGWRI